MSWENVDKLNKLFEKLSLEQKYEYIGSLFGEQLGYLWRDWDDELVDDEIKRFKEEFGVEL